MTNERRLALFPPNDYTDPLTTLHLPTDLRKKKTSF